MINKRRQQLSSRAVMSFPQLIPCIKIKTCNLTLKTTLLYLYIASVTGEKQHTIISKYRKAKKSKREIKEEGRFGLTSRRAEEAKQQSSKYIFMSTPKQVLDQQQQSQMTKVKNSGVLSFGGSPTLVDEKEEEMAMTALSAFRAKEEEIEKKKAEMRERVQAQLGRVEEETKKLAEIREELESLADPTRKEVALIRKRVDLINRDLKTIGQTCQKKEKEYKESVEAFNEKNREKAQLISKLMELVSESERLRMKKLEELSKNMDSLL